MFNLLDFADKNWDKIISWLADNTSDLTKCSIYNSCDIRYAGFKAVNVDCNFFPAGFFNLSEDGIKNGVREIKKFFNANGLYGDGLSNETADGRKLNVAIIMESYTRNIPYLEGVKILEKIFTLADCNAQVATFDLQHYDIKLERFGDTLSMHRAKRSGDTLTLVNGITPDVIIINNDMTKGMPQILEGLSTKQKIFPATKYGWFSRKKDIHFNSYSNVVGRFASHFGIDPWFFDAFFTKVDNMDFKNESGLDLLSNEVSKLLSLTQSKYDQYHITEMPKVFIKPNAGTYGMGIMVVSNVDEIVKLNKNNRNKMDIIKSGTKNTSVLLQECVPSIESIDGSPAEALCYGFNSTPCDIFYRFNADRTPTTNLNSLGAQFVNHSEIVKISTSPKTKLYYTVGSLAFIAGMEEQLD